MKLRLIALVISLSTTAALAETLKVDATSSHIGWKAGKKIGSFHEGHINVKSGIVTTDAKGIVVSANVTVDMSSIANDDLKEDPTLQKKLVGHLSSDDFFKVSKFPEATFVLKSLAPKPGASKNEYIVSGDLTIIGNTQPVSFPASIQKEKDGLKATSTVTIERLKWGLQYGSGSIFKSLTADKIINDTFDLTLDLVAKK